MSDPSALMGQTPISDTDALIRRGLLVVSPSIINPNKSQPLGPPKPSTYVFETTAPSLIAGEALAIFFILVFTTARIYVRLFSKKSFGLDDLFILPGAMGAVAYLSLDIVSQTKGCLGKHLYDCTYTEVYWFSRIAMIQEPLFYFCVFCIKLSVAFANRRITGLASKRWMKVHWVFIGLFLILLPLTVCIQAFQCVPVATRYSFIDMGRITEPSQLRCIDATSVSLSTRVLHILTDVALISVPIVILVRLRISAKKKARLIIIFALGGMSTIASILRNLTVMRYNDDITWQYYDVYVWNTIDICFAAIVASLPALNSSLDTGIERFKQWTSQSSGSRGSRKKTAQSDGKSSDMHVGIGLHQVYVQDKNRSDSFPGTEGSSGTRSPREIHPIGGFTADGGSLRGTWQVSQDSLQMVE